MAKTNGATGFENVLKSKLAYTPLTSVLLENIEWLWKGWLAKGKISILDGDPGVGKTTLAITLAACVTTGNPFPSETEKREPQYIIFHCGEDGAGDTIKPRFRAANGNASFAMVEIVSSDSKRLEIPRDIEELEYTINEHHVRFMVLDPLFSYLDPSINTHNDAQVRQAMMPLAEMAQRTGVCILAIRHFNKSSASVIG